MNEAKVVLVPSLPLVIARRRRWMRARGQARVVLATVEEAQPGAYNYKIFNTVKHRSDSEMETRNRPVFDLQDVSQKGMGYICNALHRAGVSEEVRNKPKNTCTTLRSRAQYKRPVSAGGRSKELCMETRLSMNRSLTLRIKSIMKYFTALAVVNLIRVL